MPKDVGTYIVKITAVEEGDFYNAYSGYLTNDNWKFAINFTPTITTYTDEYDGNPHPVISIEESTIPPNSIIKYSVDNGQTWYILNSNDNIPTVSTVRKQKILKFLYGYPISIPIPMMIPGLQKNIKQSSSEQPQHQIFHQ